MALIQTNKWIERYVQYTKEEKNEELYLKLFVKPLQSLFSYRSDEELAFYLKKNGMFEPGDFKGLQEIIGEEYWTQANNHFKFLKQKWNGPNVPIYLLLANKEKTKDLANVGGKMGLSFADGIVLFIPSDINESDLLALLTHEYHHVCRLMYTKEIESNVTLLESMIMEGLAEVAVQEEIGEAFVAPWVNLYKGSWKTEWEDRFIKKRLMQKGRKRYKDVLFGQSQKQIPPMLGYYYGYLLCERAAKRLKTNTRDLLSMPAEKIYKWGFEEEKRV